jgi:polysaccharide export outer membrane protein
MSHNPGGLAGSKGRQLFRFGKLARIAMKRIAISRFACWLSLLTVALGSGCSTLSSLGLPFGGYNHRMLETAEDIANDKLYPAALPSELSKTVLDRYILEPGDSILIEAADFDSPARFPGDQIIRPDGTISLGKYGDMMVAGRTIPDIRQEIQGIVDRYEAADWDRRQSAAESARVPDAENQPLLPQLVAEPPNVGPITVRLVNWDSKAYYVLGEVNSPGRFRVTGNETVLDAIVQAGDLTERANRHKIIISRPSAPCDPRLVLPICYDQIVQLGDSSTNYQIRPGDRIYVASLTFCDDLRMLFNRGDRCCPLCGPPQRGAFVPLIHCAPFCTPFGETTQDATAPPSWTAPGMPESANFHFE